MKKYRFLILVVVTVIFALPFIFIRQTSDAVIALVGQNFLLSSVIYIVLVILSIVLAPFNLPLFYIAGAIWGPVLAIVYNILGWSVGAALAFLIARTMGRPFLSRFVDLQKVDTYANAINPNIEFLGVVLLRAVLPVDVLSYALGIFSSISFGKYMLATLIGIIPFAVIFAYGGASLVSGNYIFSIGVLVAVLIATAIAAFILKKKRK